MTSKVGVDSPFVEEASGGGNIIFKKGLWTKAEDAILMDYVAKHGEGNWSSVHKKSGLARCGKSCRLRWANHLRPDLKKDAFTPEEENSIIEMQAKMGNKWSRMAAELPGRTDNEIKNYWNTRLKKQRHAGLSMYPPEVCFPAFSENKENKELGTSSSTNSHPNLLPINSFEIPSVESKNFEPRQQFYPPRLLNIAASSFLDIPATSILDQGLNSSCNTRSMLSAMHPSKRVRGSESWFSGQNVDFSNQNDGSLLAQTLGFFSSYTRNLTSDHHPSSSGTGSHAAINGNSSSLEPKWAKKLELPSLQTQIASFPSLESFGTLIQSPPNEHTDSDSLSPRNSGLLDAIVYASQTKASKNNSHQQTSSDVVNHSCPISPLGHSAASVFSEYTPITGGSLDEHQSVAAVRGENGYRITYPNYLHS
ncbi:hypothetical protein RND71_006248 [Anisodus tanguticus]|uniref:Transcription factor n=1 Tax=Anisodus tanguticus TaxID=243964 RepID=A0AAE1STM3_9SOLA|nr:hypothetical protein RND71_006248 [Anisodus tanguticus]